MSDNNDILKAIESIQSDVSNIKKDMATKRDILRVEQEQSQLAQGQAQTNTSLEAVKAGQDDLVEKVANLPTRPEFQDFRASVGRKVQDHESRIEELEKDAGIPHPHKH
jgi:hypothetical protein